MDNMGGLLKLYYIDADDFSSLEPANDDLSTLILASEAEINEIEFSQDTGKVSETEEISDNGSIYNFEVSCRIPKCGPDNSDPLGDLKSKRLLILCQDNNDNFWLTGIPGSYFNISMNSSTGGTSADINSRQLKISAALMIDSKFIVSPF
jgi:hypothetical protein